MWVLTVLTDRYSSSAISGAESLVGRYRSTRASAWLSGSRRRCGPADGDPGFCPASTFRISVIRLGGAVERLLEGPPGSARVAERVTGDRLEQERLDVPQMGVRHHHRAVDDGCERGGRRRRVILGEPQRRLGDARLTSVAFRPVQAGEGLLDAPGLPRAYERLQQVRAQPRAERVR